MDQQYLEDLLAEVESRGGGLILNVHDKPGVVVMSIDRYNALMAQSVAAGQAELPLGATGGAMAPKRTVLVTGGAGYIGGNVARELGKAGFGVVIVDNLSTGRRENLPAGIPFVEGDCGDVNLMRDVFAAHDIYAVVHLAASLEVGESVREPAKYFENNVMATSRLLDAMSEAGVRRFIFSSTGAVYGEQETVPVPETARTSPANPYGYTKLLCERIIKYHCRFLGLRAAVFRYFNVCGADLEGLVKSGHTSHILPIVLEAAAGKRQAVTVYGDDYDTFDGTCVRDYVHVLDIVRAHLLALERFEEFTGCHIYNVGTGRGLSVKEIINAAAEVTGHIIPMEVGGRRPGDPPLMIADTRKIRDELGFVPLFSEPETIITTSWQQVQRG